jgi:hypothetical protein
LCSRGPVGVLGAPLYTAAGAKRSGVEKCLRIPDAPVYGKMRGLPVPSMLTMESPHTKPPHTNFKSVWGVPAGTDDPQIRVLDNLPHYVAVRHGNRLECCNSVDSRT